MSHAFEINIKLYDDFLLHQLIVAITLQVKAKKNVQNIKMGRMLVDSSQ